MLFASSSIHGDMTAVFASSIIHEDVTALITSSSIHGDVLRLRQAHSRRCTAVASGSFTEMLCVIALIC